MRVLVNILAGLCVLVLAGALWIKVAREAEETRRVSDTAAAMRQIERTIRYKVEYEALAANPRGWPMTIDRGWFDNLPRSALVGPEHPWLEIASPAEAPLKNPPVRLAVSPVLAGLWYNPYQGVLRARVPVQVNDSRSAALYNAVNGTDLRSILEPERVFQPQRARPVEGAPVKEDPATVPTSESPPALNLPTPAPLAPAPAEETTLPAAPKSVE